VRPDAQDDVLAPQADELGGPKPGLDGHGQHRPVAPTEAGGEIRRGEQGVDLRPGEVGDVGTVVALGGDGQDPLYEPGVLGVAEGGEAEQGVDRGQPGVAGGNVDAALSLQVIEEGADERGVQVLKLQLRRRRAGGVLHEPEQEAEGVPIGGDGVGAGVALADQSFGEECLQGRGQGGHGRVPSVPSSRLAAAANRRGEAERYQYVEAGLTCPR
jgi:hypothetical protein